jgi:hypothetical protein
MKIRLAILTPVLLGATLPALATLSYTCDPSIGSGTCAALQGSTVAGEYNSIFTNINANIYITFANIGAFGESFVNLTAVPYSIYYTALGLSTNDPTAYSSLTVSDPLSAYGNTNGNIDLTPALASALDITDGGANTAGIVPDASSPSGFDSCTLGVDSPCYTGAIEISSQYTYVYPLSPSDSESGDDFFAIVEHETDETLGTISCIGTNVDSEPYDQCNPTGTDASPADLFRYASSGVRSFLNADNGTPAYFSIDGGVTDIADYTNTPNSGDYGDWVFNGTGKVQDAELPYGTADITTDGGSEIDVLNAVGFNLSTPEPGSLGLLGAGLAILTGIRAASSRRRQKQD